MCVEEDFLQLKNILVGALWWTNCVKVRKTKENFPSLSRLICAQDDLLHHRADFSLTFLSQHGREKREVLGKVEI